MQAIQTAGREAAFVKYDILTALGTHALGQGGHSERLALRLMTLIVARYDWQRQRLAVGQREIAQLWSVDERTVKREMGRLRALGWLSVTRQGARGRVTEYRLDVDTVLAATRACWHRVGSDYADRMDGRGRPADNVVPLPTRAAHGPGPDPADDSAWGRAMRRLHSEDPALYRAWLCTLVPGQTERTTLHISAASRFHASYIATHLKPRLLAALGAIGSDLTELTIDIERPSDAAASVPGSGAGT